MTLTLTEILLSPLPYVLLIVLVWLARAAIQHTVRGAVDHQFSLRIEDHKHDLQRIAELERFDLQRRLAGASLYLQKQHAAAAEVWAGIRVAHGFIAGLFGLQRTLTLDDCSELDLRALMKEYEVLDGKQNELLGKWQADRASGIGAIKEHLFELRVPRAENKLQVARNLMYLHEIYFSDDAIDAFDQFVARCNEWLMRATLPPQRGQKTIPLSRDALNASMERVHAALRAELSDPINHVTAFPKSS